MNIHIVYGPRSRGSENKLTAGYALEIYQEAGENERSIISHVANEHLYIMKAYQIFWSSKRSMGARTHMIIQGTKSNVSAFAFFVSEFSAFRQLKSPPEIYSSQTCKKTSKAPREML